MRLNITDVGEIFSKVYGYLASTEYIKQGIIDKDENINTCFTS